MKVFEALADALVAEGVEHVFALMGDGNLDLLIALRERGVTLVHARHEQYAVAMADGYARVTGRIGVCTVTHGPGLTQTGTSLVVARTARSPVLLIAGDTPAGNRHHVQSFDQPSFIRATAGPEQQLRSPATAAEDIQAAFRRLRADPCPVVLNAPTDVQLARVPDGATPYRPARAGVPTSAPSSARVGQAAELIANSRRPVLLFGRGAVLADAEAPALALIERLGQPFATSLLAKGFMAGHALSRGVSGGLGAPAARQALMDSDCVISIGGGLNVWTTSGGAIFEGAALVQVDRDPMRIGEFVEPDVALLGDAADTSRALDAALAERDATFELAPDLRAEEERPAEWSDGERTVDPRRAMSWLDQALPTERVVVLDGGHFGEFGTRQLAVDDPRDFVFGPSFGTVGQGLGLSIGACFARPGRRVTLVVGDGGLLMSIQELDTAVRYGLDLTVVVLNDEAFGQEVHSLAAKGLPVTEALFPSPDVRAIAAGYGARSFLVEDPDDLPALSASVASVGGGPLLIDIRTNRAVVAQSSQEIFAAVRAGIPTS